MLTGTPAERARFSIVRDAIATAWERADCYPEGHHLRDHWHETADAIWPEYQRLSRVVLGEVDAYVGRDT